MIKSKLTEEEFDQAMSIIFSRIQLIKFEEFSEFIIKAKSICPDPDDTEYFALALKEKYPIWTNDKRLKDQEEIKIISTTELIGILNN